MTRTTLLKQLVLFLRAYYHNCYRSLISGPKLSVYGRCFPHGLTLTACTSGES